MIRAGTAGRAAICAAVTGSAAICAEMIGNAMIENKRIGSDMLRIYHTDETAEWDRIVKSFSEYDFYYLNGYAKSVEVQEHEEVVLFYYESEHLRGINVVQIRKINDIPFFRDRLEDRYYDLTTPYGYGGWLLEEKGDISVVGELDREYSEWCRDHHIVSEFVRVHPVIANERYLKDFYRVLPCGSVIAIDTKEPDRIWTNMESKTRKSIRKARRNEFCVRRSTEDEAYEALSRLYYRTMDRVQADGSYYFSEDYFRTMKKELKSSTQIFLVETKEKEIAAAAMMMGENGLFTGHLAGTEEDYLSLGVVSLLYYEAAVWAGENGYDVFHLGGGVGFKRDSLFAFKASFTKNGEREHFFANKIFDREIYDKLLWMRTEKGTVRQNAGSGYFPEYRAESGAAWSRPDKL
ncbi:MAG: GNAT family N-acetyltransferase [Eubacterium sp.]|nr:GNAT family N-acetyltransferase [Eubacterium sp.]